MPLMDIGEARLWYEDTSGDGVPVVFVHPAAGSSASWESQVPAFVEAGYRCITYDLRGWGRSRQAPGAPGPGNLGDDLSALTQVLGLDRFILVAAAYGGMGALDYMLGYQDRVRAFVLATSQGAIDDTAFKATVDRVVPPEIRALPIELRELGPSYRAEDPAGVEHWLRTIHEAGAETAPRQSRFHSVTFTSLESLHIPTLVLAADADLLAPPALMRLIAARIPGSEFVAVADAGHSAHWERPAEWNRLVLDFLARH